MQQAAHAPAIGVGDPPDSRRESGPPVIRAAIRAVNGGESALVAAADAGVGLGGRVLVLNATYEPINVCTMRRAAVLVLKQRAEVIESGDGALRAEHLRFVRPSVIRLVRYVRVPRDVHRRRITRKAVLARDDYTCQYCGREAHGMTVDHVIPRSRGGSSAWDNIVAACAPCNRKKGSRLPREAKMPLRSVPRPPGPNVFIRIASPRVPDVWEAYLLAA